jgi:hypothetical protein
MRINIERICFSSVQLALIDADNCMPGVVAAICTQRLSFGK